MYLLEAIKEIKRGILAKVRGEYTLHKLIKRGLKVGENVHIERTAWIDDSHCWLITIGDNVLISPRVHILAHDGFTKQYLGYARIGRVTIGNQVCIGSEAIILPNVTIGDNVLIGAGCVVTKDIPSGSIVVGNPARIIGKFEDYLNKNKELMRESPIYDESWTLRGRITKEKKEQMKRTLENKIGFVE